jgi:peptidoglycan/LPS O-acetylase OafA/YrhL
MDQRSERIPELDGLRGLAILMVMVCHFSGDQSQDRWALGLQVLAAAGWIGVDLFFALSGFLITGILLASRGSEGALRHFYARRVLRIWPVYLVALVVLLVVLPNTNAYDAVDRWWFSAHQWYYWLHGMDFAPTPEGVFGYHTVHFWSLSLEEQFYLIWPLAVLTLSDRRLRWVLGAVVVMESVLRIGLALTDSPARAIAQHVLHIQPLAAGAWLAIEARAPGGLGRYARYARPAALVGALGLGLLFLDAPGLDKNAPLPFALTVTACAVGFGGLLLRAVTGGSTSRLAAVMRAPWLRWMGRYSYAMYVVHMPLVAAAERLDFTWRSFPAAGGSALPGYLGYVVVLGVASMGLAFVSWHVLEKHCLALRRFFPRPAIARQLGPDEPAVLPAV